MIETAPISAVGFAVAITNQMARRLRVPPILIYLLVGVLAGPSVLGVFDPEDLDGVFRTSLELLVGLLLRRPEEGVIPNGDTVLRRGNRLLLFGRTEAVLEARGQLALIE